MHHPTDRIIHTTAFVTPVVEHWLEREIAQWVHPMKDRSDDPSHHARMLLPRSYMNFYQSHYILLMVHNFNRFSKMKKTNSCLNTFIKVIVHFAFVCVFVIRIRLVRTVHSWKSKTIKPDFIKHGRKEVRKCFI